MVLPRKKSRIILVNKIEYRWLVSMHDGILHLTIELSDCPGQILRAFFEPHPQFKRKLNGQWSFQRQGRSITPNIVTKIIGHGLANGWQPSSPQKPFYIHTWDSETIVPKLIESADNEIPLKDIAINQIDRLRFDVSLDPYWRKILFDAPPSQRFPLPDDYIGLSDLVRECGLRFSVFNDGWYDDGFVVFGIESLDFPTVIMYTTNNPNIL
ncbi:MAG: hypothetical protein AAGA60_32080 [Cyanobacteria bacterium P01_E01_bin.42]